MDFEQEHLSIIEKYESSALEIERAFFTKRYKISKKHFSLLSIQSISILYSYWEGYIQRSFQLYIEYLNLMDLEFSNLCDGIVIFQMENNFKQFKEYPQNNSKKIAFYNSLMEYFSDNKHEIYNKVNTESNVGFTVLNNLLKIFSLEPFKEQWGDYVYPRRNLKESLDTFLRYRNGVAHGGDVSSEEKVTQAVYSGYRKLIVDLMYEIHYKFMDGINNKTYLKSTNDVRDGVF